MGLFVIFYQMVTKLQTFWHSRKYKLNVLQKHPLHPISVGVHECNQRLRKQKYPSCCWSAPTVPLISEGQRLSSCRGKKDGDAAISNLEINIRILCDKSAHVVTTAGNNIAFKIAVKPLQIETWYHLTAYRSCHRPIQLYRR